MLKVKNREMINLLENGIFKQNLPASMSFKLALLKKDLEGPFEVFNKERTRIVEKYCDRGEDGKPILGSQGEFTFSDSSIIAEVNTEITELLDTQFNINNDKVKLDMQKLDDTGIRLSADDMAALLPFVDVI